MIVGSMRAGDDLLSAAVIRILCRPAVPDVPVLTGLRQRVSLGWILAVCVLLVRTVFGLLRWHRSPRREPDSTG